MVASALLLEGLVLLCAVAQWSGSRNQSLYGTGQAEVWEVFGNHGHLADSSSRQDWLNLEPLNSSACGKVDFVGHMSKTIDYGSPRFGVMECSTKH